jgi:hypothetical protein
MKSLLTTDSDYENLLQSFWDVPAIEKGKMEDLSAKAQGRSEATGMYTVKCEPEVQNFAIAADTSTGYRLQISMSKATPSQFSWTITSVWSNVSNQFLNIRWCIWLISKLLIQGEACLPIRRCMHVFSPFAMCAT